MKALIDTNIVMDYYAHREPFFDSARKFLLLGAAGEFDIWIGASQLTDVFYLLTAHGGGMTVCQAKESLSRLREHIHVCSLGEDDVDAALASTWEDFEDACIHQCSLKLKVDAIITRNKADFAKSTIQVFDCDEFFAFLERTRGIAYDEVGL